MEEAFNFARVKKVFSENFMKQLKLRLFYFFKLILFYYFTVARSYELYY